MLSRNQIRQAALQYLYAASQTPETEREGIWDILMEPFRGDYCKLKAKAVSGHLTRDYPDNLCTPAIMCYDAQAVKHK